MSSSDKAAGSVTPLKSEILSSKTESPGHERPTGGAALGSQRDGTQTLSERRSFSPPAEADWHRMISEAAYFIAAKRNFAPGNLLEDWLQAEIEVREMLNN